MMMMMVMMMMTVRRSPGLRIWIVKLGGSIFIFSPFDINYSHPLRLIIPPQEEQEEEEEASSIALLESN